MRNVTKTNLLKPAAFRLLLAFCCVAMTALAGAPPAFGQQDQEQPGITYGNYNIKQSMELGYRVSDVAGNTQTYDTFVNLNQGPRLLDFTTEMTSLNHQGLFFDRLYFSSFGYGGDPNNASRLRISKDKWYNFNSSFRRDVNAWDYSLLANPLNPTAPTFTNAPAGFTPIINVSPHALDTVRRSSDFDLAILPQSRVSFRLGYSQNISEGPSLTTYHQGTEALLFQDWKTTVNAYRMGVDLKLLPRTNISYDQFLSYYKGDTGIQDKNQGFSLSNGTPVDIGIALNAGAGQPCGGTFTATAAVNATCNAFLSYSQNGRVRTSSPTEQISFQSDYFKRLDLSGRVSYTGGNMIVSNGNAQFAGRESRSNLSNASLFGPISGRRVAATADAGATLHLAGNWSLIDTFHFSNFHDPSVFNASSCEFFSPNLLTPANVFGTANSLPVICTSPAGALTGTPTHSTSSAADLSLSLSSLFLKQDEKTNLVEAEYQISQKLGARLGYRFRHRSIVNSNFEQTEEVFFPSNANRGDCALASGLLPTGCVSNGDGSFTFTTPGPITPNVTQIAINEHSGVFGIWAKPLANWRISFDTEIMSADNAYTRISPRQTQDYRIRSTYQPMNWLNFSGSINIWEGRDNVAEVNNLQHNRAYGLSVSLEPNSKFSLEVGYDYNDVYSQILICYTSTTEPAGLAKCPGSTVLVQQLSTYVNLSHFGYFNASIMPTKRLTARLGANITANNGSAILLDPTAPPGTLNSRYYQPFAGLEYQFVKRWTGKAYWGYYGYNEGLTAVPQDINVPRNFRGNLETLSVRYAF